MNDSSELIYMDRARVGRALKRMAYQVAEDNRANNKVCLFGVKERGFVIASELAHYLSGIYNDEIPVAQISFDEEFPRDEAYQDGNSSYPLIVDDVIFSGRTMFKALKMAHDSVAFSTMHTAVLVDRGHRKFPIQAQFVGLELSTKLREHVSVVIDQNKVDKVILEMS